MKKTGALLLALVAVFFWVAPSFAGKAALSEKDLDSITAAGEPKIIELSGITASGNVSVTFTDTGSFDFNISPNSQTTLRALTVNNIVGENEIANALNISTATATNTNTQSNTIYQSWGSTKDIGVATVAGVNAGNGGSGGNGAVGGGATAVVVAVSVNGQEEHTKCFANCSSPATASLGNVTGGNGGNGGNGGAGGNGAAGLIAPLIMTADQIFDLANVTSSTGTISLSITEAPSYQLNIASGSQTTLAALVLNNVVGKNMIANAINISSGAINVIGDPFIAPTGSGNNATQSNKICQFRGTPQFAIPGVITVGGSTC